MVKLNLGCGPIQPNGWVNVDGSFRAWFASKWTLLDRLFTWCRLLPATEFGRSTHYANLLKVLPWQSDSVDCIYMGEVLEHFTREDGMALVKECYRILKPGGVIRIRVPDNVRFWRLYIEEFDRERNKPRANWGDDHVIWVERFFRDICVKRRLLASFGHYHKWMYDEISLIHTLERSGFKDVQRKAFHDSVITDIRVVESRDDLIVEGVKPVS